MYIQFHGHSAITGVERYRPCPIHPSTFSNTNLRLFQCYWICSMAEIRSSIDEIKVFFGTSIIFLFLVIRDFVGNFIENKAFLHCNIFNNTETAVGLYCKRLKVELGGVGALAVFTAYCSAPLQWLHYDHETGCSVHDNIVTTESNHREDHETRQELVKNTVYSLFLLSKA